MTTCCLQLLMVIYLIQLSLSNIPTIDLSNSDEISSKNLFDAATKYGFFYLKNHEILSNTIQKLLSFNKQLFDLDLDIKLQLKQNLTHWGYMPYKYETVDLDQQIEPDTKEGFYIRSNKTYPLSPLNQWPSNELILNFKSFILDYLRQLDNVAIKLAQLIALSLNLSADYFERPGMKINFIYFSELYL